MKLKWHIFVIITFFFLLTQLVFFDHIEIYDTSPQILLILLTYLALNLSIPETFVSGFFIGIVMDISSCERIGLFCFLLGIASGFVLKIRKEASRENPFFDTILVFSVVFQCNFFHACILFLLNRCDFQWELVAKILICSLYSAITSPLLFFFFEKISLVKLCKKQ